MVVFGMPSYHYTSWYYRSAYVRYPACTRYHSYHHHRYPYSRNGFNNSYRKSNIVVKNNTINVNGRNSGISTGNRYDFDKKPAQSRPTRVAADRTRTGGVSDNGISKTRPKNNSLDQRVNKDSGASRGGNSSMTKSYRANEIHRENWNNQSIKPQRTPSKGGRRR